MKFRNLLSALLLMGSLTSIAHAESPVDLNKMKMTFSDEFSSPSLDNGKWQPYYTQASTINGELQYYTPDAVVPDAANGILRLRADKRKFNGKNYTSGAIVTSGRFYQTYGYFEMRAKFPTTRGFWPAFWLLSEDQTWPPEIDIVEHLSYQPDVAYLTYHYRENNTNKSNGTVAYKSTADLTKDYHKYAVSWQPNLLIWYVDDVERARFTGPNVSNKPAYILANLALGGWATAPDSNSVFPATMDIDYIRVYQYNNVPAGVPLELTAQPLKITPATVKSGDVVTIETTVSPNRTMAKGGAQIFLTDLDGGNWQWLNWTNLALDKAGTQAKVSFQYKVPAGTSDGLKTIAFQVFGDDKVVYQRSLAGRFTVKNTTDTLLPLQPLPDPVKPTPAAVPALPALQVISALPDKESYKPNETVTLNVVYKWNATLPNNGKGSLKFTVVPPFGSPLVASGEFPPYNIGNNNLYQGIDRLPSYAPKGVYKVTVSGYAADGKATSAESSFAVK